MLCGVPNKPLEPTAGMRWSSESRLSFTRGGSAPRRSVGKVYRHAALV